MGRRVCTRCTWGGFNYERRELFRDEARHAGPQAGCAIPPRVFRGLLANWRGTLRYKLELFMRLCATGRSIRAAGARKTSLLEQIFGLRAQSPKSSSPAGTDGIKEWQNSVPRHGRNTASQAEAWSAA